MAIMGILVSIAYVSFGQARAQARDDVRQADLQQLQLAIELYKSENGQYPEMGCRDTNSESWVGRGPHSSGWGNNNDCPEYIVGLVPKYLPALPEDPSREFQNNRGYIYRTINNRQDYKLLAHLVVEAKFVEDFDHPLARCPVPNPGSSWCDTNTLQSTVYAVYSYGARFQ